MDRLRTLIKTLLDTENGCPWLLQQDMQAIIPYTIEETYEVVDAIEREDMKNLCEELGDLLFQVLLYAHYAEEKKAFTFEDVARGLEEKLIRRHPHVFGDAGKKSLEELELQWQRIKKQEKLKCPSSIEEKYYLDKVKTASPPYEQALDLQKAASQVGFDWEDYALVFTKIFEEMEELKIAKECGNKNNIKEELGDLLFTVLNLARLLEVDPRSALAQTNNKFRKRFAYIERQLKASDLDLNSASLQEMEHLWQQAKTNI